MSTNEFRHPRIDRLFGRYLQSNDSAAFVRHVSERYTITTLQRLAERGGRITRRAAVLALSLLGGYESNPVLGAALHDPDRGVRLLAEDGIRSIWLQAGNVNQRRQLMIVMRLIRACEFEEALCVASGLIAQASQFAETWNQRAIAHFCLGRYYDSMQDCQQTLELNPYHFAAAAGMGQCYLELADPLGALQCFEQALQLNPGLEGVRAEIAHLQRALKER